MTKTTIVLMGYNVIRFNKNKDIIFTEYDKYSKFIDKIVFIWNNQTEPMPMINKMKNIQMIIINAEKNSLCNRHHIAYKHISTESVLIIDEDIILDKQCIYELIHLWERNKNDVIGISGRSYDMFGNYYFSDHKFRTSLTIGQTMMYHKKYMLEFAKHTKLHQEVDNGKCYHCDDLVFQIMVHMLDSKNCTRIVKTNEKTRNLDSTGAVSIIPNWRRIRSSSIRTALKYFKKETTIMKIYRYIRP